MQDSIKKNSKKLGHRTGSTSLRHRPHSMPASQRSHGGSPTGGSPLVSVGVGVGVAAAASCKDAVGVAATASCVEAAASHIFLV